MSKTAPSLTKYDEAPPPVPHDFVEVYIRIGIPDVQAYYGARRTTVEHWLAVMGDAITRRQRSMFVKGLRQAPTLVKPKALTMRQDYPPVDEDLAHLAADFLRCVRNGGWMISRTRFGDWCVGIGLKSSLELVAMAERKGFDVERANLQVRAQRRIG